MLIRALSRELFSDDLVLLCIPVQGFQYVKIVLEPGQSLPIRLIDLIMPLCPGTYEPGPMESSIS